ncbi:hypothetical protein M5K25_027027 [Dendrobium thyrsiflorum]|uniref:Uncharacterized protein n=1 Tax=Dendrobium thyrsiflorum TaxID=117978 RepID=A0ABD0TYW9_DENTH
MDPSDILDQALALCNCHLDVCDAIWELVDAFCLLVQVLQIRWRGIVLSSFAYLYRLEEEDEVEGEEEEEERERKWEGMVGNLKGGRKKKKNGEKEGGKEEEEEWRKRNGGRRRRRKREELYLELWMEREAGGRLESRESRRGREGGGPCVKWRERECEGSVG